MGMVMCLQAGEEIGLDVHDQHDQFIRVEVGQARIAVGPSEAQLEVAHEVADDWSVIIPARVWPNVINTGSTPLRLYSVNAPAEHPDGTVHDSKAEADAAQAAAHVP